MTVKLLADRVVETCAAAIGTGDILLEGALGSAGTWLDAFGAGEPVEYLIETADGLVWEKGLATTASGPDRLTGRDPLESSNGGALVDFDDTAVKYVYSPVSAWLLRELIGGFEAAARPAWLPPGTPWTKSLSSSRKERYHWDGTADTLLYVYDPDNGRVVWEGARGADIADGATPDIAAALGESVTLLGTTTITGFPAAPRAGIRRRLRLAAARQITHHGSNLILLTGANIAGAAGDMMAFESLDAAGAWRMLWYSRANGRPLQVDGADIVSGTVPAARLPTATDSARGVAELATAAEAAGLSDPDRVVTPAALGGASLVRVQVLQAASGGVVDFGSIPAWVQRVTLLFDRVSLSGSDSTLVRLGDSGGIETTGYSSSGSRIGGSVATINGSDGFQINTNNATEQVSGQIALTLIDAADNRWIASGTLTSQGGITYTAAGSKALSDPLETVRVTRSGSNTFDNGSLSIVYE